MILAAFAPLLVLTLGLPSMYRVGGIMIVIGGFIITETSPAWLRFLVGLAAFMAAGVLINEAATGGLDRARFDLGF